MNLEEHLLEDPLLIVQALCLVKQVSGVLLAGSRALASHLDRLDAGILGHVGSRRRLGNQSVELGLCTLQQLNSLLCTHVFIARNAVHAHLLAQAVLVGFDVLLVLDVDGVRGLQVVVSSVLLSGLGIFLLFLLHFLS
jgi:hypothetical protein